MRLRNSNFILIAFCLYLATVGIRFYGITEASVQIDERHWTERSDVVVKKFKQRSFLNLTTHLGHPGVPPGIMMAVAQALSARLNRNDNDVTSEISIRPLIASRIASVLASSLLIPLLFLGLLPFVGVAVSFLAAALFSLDPLHISLSRQAHLDGFLTLFVFSSFILYLHAIARGSLFFKLLSGVLWGLAIATKPTAAPLVAILLVSRIIYRFISREQNAANTKIIEWSDIWTVVVGHVVFGALYTRLWFHESDYLLRLGIKSRFADLLYYAGSQLHTATILLSLILAIALTLVCIRKKEKISWQYQLFTLGLVLLALIALFPAVIENLARYWCWALGLSSMKHHAYGMNWAPVPGGYAIILLSRMPTLVLLFAAVGIIYLAIRFLFRPNGTRLSDSIVTCCILGLCIWLVPLSVSSKQTIRYAMPMIPARLFLSATGI